MDPVDLSAPGVGGFDHLGGRLQEGHLDDLRGPPGVKVCTSMANSAALAGALFHMGQAARTATWGVEDAGTSPIAVEAGRIVRTSIDDMREPWGDVVDEGFRTAITYGYWAAAWALKVRAGRNPNVKALDSRFDDRRIGLQTLSIRHPTTVDRWEIDDDTEEVHGLVQVAPPTYREHPIPIERLLLWRARGSKGSPEGASLLKTAYRAWYRMTTAEDLELIGLERNIAGIPVATIPPAVYADASKREEWKRFVRRLRVNELQGVVMPAAEINGQTTGYSLSLLQTAGTQAVVADAIIRRDLGVMLSAFAAEYTRVGADLIGARSVAETKHDALATATHGFLVSIADAFTRQIVPVLMEANGIGAADWPRLVVDRPSIESLTELAAWISAGIAGGFLTPGDADESWWREKGDMPPRTATWGG